MEDVAMAGETNENGFTGEYYHSIDDKCRTSLPVRLRDGIGEKFYMMRGYGGNERCILVFPIESFEAYKEKIMSKPLKGQKGRDRRRTISGAVPMEFGLNGRVVIPRHLIEYAMIDKEVVSVGEEDRVEIWAKEVWKDYTENNMTMEKDDDDDE